MSATVRRLLSAGAAIAGILVLWEFLVRLTGTPAFILPPPSRVGAAFLARPDYYLGHAAITASEIIIGLVTGTLLGMATALVIAASPRLERLVGPALVASQALPVFAIAPLLVIWLGFGLASKIAMAALIIYFPVATAFADGLRRTDPGLLDLARLGGAGRGATLGLITYRPPCPRSAPACALPPALPRSAPLSANGSAPPPALASSCCMPMPACRPTASLSPWSFLP